jgi:hypothetical protein
LAVLAASLILSGIEVFLTGSKAFFVEIHSPWQSSRAHGNSYLCDLAFV